MGFIESNQRLMMTIMRKMRLFCFLRYIMLKLQAWQFIPRFGGHFCCRVFIRLPAVARIGIKGHAPLSQFLNSSFILQLRGVIFFAVMIVLTALLGYMGILLAQCISDIITLIIGLLLVKKMRLD